MSGAGAGQQTGGNAWGNHILPSRQAELEALHVRQAGWAARPEAERGDSIFKDVNLTGADVFWLAARVMAGTGEARAVATATDKLRQIRRASAGDFIRVSPNLAGLHLEGATLYWALLEGAVLDEAHLEGANLRWTRLERASLSATHLEGADLIEACLEGADLSSGHLEGAALVEAKLEGADLIEAKLERAYLSRAHLENANLSWAHLEGADLVGAHLKNARLTHAYLDSETNLTGAEVSDHAGWLATVLDVMLERHSYGAVSLADVRWNGADLTVVDWSGLRKVGDERGERWWWRDREEAEVATRANIQLSKQLDNAGLKDDADRFAYRAQVCQRGVHLHRLRLGLWLFSWLLFIIAGYGYRPLRTLFWYLAIIFGFALAYVHFGHINGQPFEFDEALVFSVTSFHGRGFFPGTLSLKDLVTKLAAAEAVLGLFIEASFIATFTQRYFGK